jgi:hypothetical protein
MLVITTVIFSTKLQNQELSPTGQQYDSRIEKSGAIASPDCPQ